MELRVVLRYNPKASGLRAPPENVFLTGLQTGEEKRLHAGSGKPNLQC